MWNWFSKNAQPFAALFSALALVGVLYQVAAGERAQREQSARDIYREFIALTINRPELVSFEWIPEAPEKDRIAYEAYVEYMLYTSEQVISVDAEWQQTMRGWFENHTVYLCTFNELGAYTPAVQALITDVTAGLCKSS